MSWRNRLQLSSRGSCVSVCVRTGEHEVEKSSYLQAWLSAFKNSHWVPRSEKQRQGEIWRSKITQSHQ